MNSKFIFSSIALLLTLITMNVTGIAHAQAPVVAPTCPPGYVFSAGQCVQGAPAPTCPAGFVFSGGQCLPSAAPQRPAESRPAEVVPQPSLSPYELTQAIQKELARVGCSPGQADGDWGARTRNALAEFNRLTGLTLDVGGPNTSTLDALAATGNVICVAAAPAPAPQRPVVRTNNPPPVKKQPQTVKKAPPKKKKKEAFGGEDSKVKCASGIITEECF